MPLRLSGLLPALALASPLRGVDLDVESHLQALESVPIPPVSDLKCTQCQCTQEDALTATMKREDGCACLLTDGLLASSGKGYACFEPSSYQKQLADQVFELFSGDVIESDRNAVTQGAVNAVQHAQHFDALVQLLLDRIRVEDRGGMRGFLFGEMPLVNLVQDAALGRAASALIEQLLRHIFAMPQFNTLPRIAALAAGTSPTRSPESVASLLERLWKAMLKDAVALLANTDSTSICAHDAAIKIPDAHLAHGGRVPGWDKRFDEAVHGTLVPVA